MKIKDICKIQSSKRVHENDYCEYGIPCIRGKEITDGSLNNPNTHFDCYISEELFNSIKEQKGAPQKGDILITAVGTIGNVLKVDTDRDFYFKDGNVIWLSEFSSDVYPDFLYYYLKSEFIKTQINRNLIGAVQKALTLDMFGNLSISLPSIEMQKEISSCLRKLDAKLTNNDAIISELESMVKDIYDYWCVQFDFPDENGKPYKSSGGKMVWNEELKRDIPEGWKADKLGSIVSVITNRINAEQIGHRKYIPIEVIPRNKMSFYETADIDKAATGLCSFNKGAILLSNRRVYFHKVSISPFDGVTRDTVIIMEAQKDNLGYAYQIVNSDHFINYATRFSYGSEQPVLSTPSALAYDISCPNNAVDLKYSRFVAPLIEKVLSLEQENEELTSLRDFLLPLLMNGQVKIGDIEA